MKFLQGGLLIVSTAFLFVRFEILHRVFARPAQVTNGLVLHLGHIDGG